MVAGAQDEPAETHLDAIRLLEIGSLSRSTGQTPVRCCGSLRLVVALQPCGGRVFFVLSCTGEDSCCQTAGERLVRGGASQVRVFWECWSRVSCCQTQTEMCPSQTAGDCASIGCRVLQVSGLGFPCDEWRETHLDDNRSALFQASQCCFFFPSRCPARCGAVKPCCTVQVGVQVGVLDQVGVSDCAGAWRMLKPCRI